MLRSGSRESNSDSPAPKAGGFPSSLDPEVAEAAGLEPPQLRLTAGCSASELRPNELKRLLPTTFNGWRRNRTAGGRLMRSALFRLSYPAARLLDRRKLAQHDSEAPLCMAPLRVRRHDGKNLRHNFHHSGPCGSRTHYLSIKSRELILMSFRPL